MHAIHLHDPAWLTTFQHIVEPNDDEWFPGLLLRCDEVNGWESGTTLAELLRLSGRYFLKGKPSWTVVPSSALEWLAQLLAVPMSTLLATTYQSELARLYDTSSPYATFLSRWFPFHLCPDCIREKHVLRRILALPSITCCPFHQMQLVRTCQCGTMLQLFHKQALPFTCHTCRLDWAKLPRLSADPECIAVEHKFLLHYEFFFTDGTPILLSKALQLVREKVKREKMPWVRCPDGSTKYVECYDGRRVALGSLVELLVSLDFSPQDIVSYEGPLPWWSLKFEWL
jgi:TniQ